MPPKKKRQKMGSGRTPSTTISAKATGVKQQRKRYVVTKSTGTPRRASHPKQHDTLVRPIKFEDEDGNDSNEEDEDDIVDGINDVKTNHHDDDDCSSSLASGAVVGAQAQTPVPHSTKMKPTSITVPRPRRRLKKIMTKAKRKNMMRMGPTKARRKIITPMKTQKKGMKITTEKMITKARREIMMRRQKQKKGTTKIRITEKLLQWRWWIVGKQLVWHID